MQYDFSAYLKNDLATIFDDYIEQSTFYIDIQDDCNSATVINYYRDILKLFKASFCDEDILKLFEELANFQDKNSLPYLIFINEIYNLKNILLDNIVSEGRNAVIAEFLELFKTIGNRVAHVYLTAYINKLVSVNNVRRNSLSDLVEKNFIQHYESHLLWLTKLATCIKEENLHDFPELNADLCDFGKWLHNDAKKIIQNNSKYNTLDTLHDNLHLFGKKIGSYLQKASYHLLITYLEKCELISLSIGTELALIDNILINNTVIKDSLTGALNRHALKNVFENQYELSLATNNPFVLAICDLDYFKEINDQYGHIAGDRMLKLFVDTVKNHIRNSDIIIRYGGEEFIIMLPAINKEHGLKILETIRKEFQNSSLAFEDKTIQATVSMGMMEIKPEQYYKTSFTDEYIMIVDQKLYNAKNNGRNRIEVY